MSGYGLSSEQIADVLEQDARTILWMAKSFGKKVWKLSSGFMDFNWINLNIYQMDEIWSYLQKKKHQIWLFITIESKTKFWVNFRLGSRTSDTAHRLLNTLVYLLPWGFEHFLLVTTDKLAAYEKAIANHFNNARYAYIQIVRFNSCPGRRRCPWILHLHCFVGTT